MSIAEALQWATDQLSLVAGDLAQNQAEEFLSAILITDKMNVYLQRDQELSLAQWQTLQNYVVRRQTHEPLQHIIGSVSFMDVHLRVSADVLVPRPETEQLCAWLIEELSDTRARVLDLCTGSGAIAVALAKACPQLEIVATDVSEAALTIARENVVHNGCGDSVTCVQGDLWAAVEGQFDWIISNPPYIETEEIRTLDPEVKDFDPLLALDGGADGLQVYRRIFAGLGTYLKEQGKLVLEMGEKQGYPIMQLGQESGLTGGRVMRDDYGKERFCVFEHGCDTN